MRLDNFFKWINPLSVIFVLYKLRILRLDKCFKRINPLSVIFVRDKSRMQNLYFPEYLMLWELNGDGIAKHFFYKCDYGIVLYPFLMRKINDLEFFQQMKIDEIFYDITSPYGYGGPLVKPCNKIDRKLLLEGFIKEFSLFCKKK